MLAQHEHFERALVNELVARLREQRENRLAALERLSAADREAVYQKLDRQIAAEAAQREARAAADLREALAAGAVQ